MCVQHLRVFGLRAGRRWEAVETLLCAFWVRVTVPPWCVVLYQ